MSLLAFYDTLLADIPGFLLEQKDESDNRVALLRHQLDQRLIGELSLDVHSVGPAALVPYLGTAIRCYIAGFYDVSIRDATSRLRSALQGRLLAMLLWDPSGNGQLIIAAANGQISSASAEKYRANKSDPFNELSDSDILILSIKMGILSGAWQERLINSMQTLLAKNKALEQRDRDQGRQMTIHAIENGRESGGPGAVHTESVLGFYLTWGADLHLLLADVAMVVCLVLMAGNRQKNKTMSN